MSTKGARGKILWVGGVCTRDPLGVKEGIPPPSLCVVVASSLACNAFLCDATCVVPFACSHRFISHLNENFASGTIYISTMHIVQSI